MKSGQPRRAETAGEGPDGIALGHDLARTLGVTVGDSVTVLTPEGTLTPMGIDAPRTRRCGWSASSRSASSSSTGLRGRLAARRRCG